MEAEGFPGAVSYASGHPDGADELRHVRVGDDHAHEAPGAGMGRELGGVLEAVEGFVRFAALEHGARSLALLREWGMWGGLLRNVEAASKATTMRRDGMVLPFTGLGKCVREMVPVASETGSDAVQSCLVSPA